MWVVIAASFVAMAMSGVHCWPDMANIAALYTNKKMLRNFDEFKKEGPIKKLAIGFKNYYFINRLEMQSSSKSVEVSGECHIRDFIKTDFKAVNSTHFECSMKESVCLFEALHIASKDDFNMTNLVLYGYEAKLHKYVGCFMMKNFTELTAEYVDCELTCSDTPFYGFTSTETCACIERLPNTEIKLSNCQECPRKKAIFCGTEEISVSIYTKRSMQERIEIDPILYESCMKTDDVSCPNCIEGRSGFMCMAINCPDINCGSKSCEGILHLKLDISFCFCLGGFYTDDALECQDIDECAEDEICKHRNRTCLNTRGNFVCKCEAGFYELDMVHCADIDECQNETICDRSTTTCKNLYGDFECACLEGYIKVDPVIRNGSCIEQKWTFLHTVLPLVILLLLVVVIIIWFRFKKVTT